MKKMVVVIVRGTSEVPAMIKKMFKENFPGLVNEVKFNLELKDFLKIKPNEGVMIFANNPFKEDNYPLFVEPNNFEALVKEKVGEINAEAKIHFFFSQASNEKEIYENHAEEFLQIFNSLDLLKAKLPNIPGPSSFIPTSATESLFFNK